MHIATSVRKTRMMSSFSESGPVRNIFISTHNGMALEYAMPDEMEDRMRFHPGLHGESAN